MPDICPGSGEPIPLGGSVHCLCGRVWTDHGREGPRFRVPLHDRQGHPQDAAKLAARIDRAWDAAARSRRERAALEAERQARVFAGWDRLHAMGHVEYKRLGDG